MHYILKQNIYRKTRSILQNIIKVKTRKQIVENSGDLYPVFTFAGDVKCWALSAPFLTVKTLFIQIGYDITQ